MTVTNNIRKTVKYDNKIGWLPDEDLKNEEIISKLKKEKRDGFLSFSWGVWCTSYARYNLIHNLIQLDEFEIYADTDSLKLKEGYNKQVIEDYNKQVIEKLQKVSSDRGIPFERFAPKDSEEIPHCLGLFELDAQYQEFITQGAKKYAYTKWIKKSKVKNKEDVNILEEKEDKYLVLEITVSGVPKSGAKGLKKLEDFKDNFVFEHKDTGKNLLIYNDDQIPFEFKDIDGNKVKLTEKIGSCIVPTTYELGRSEDYINLLSDESSARALYKE